MLYIALVALSLVSCGISFAYEIVSGNITHIKCGREPNAGAAILPAILLVPALYVLIAWRLNEWHANRGYIVVAICSVLSIAIQMVLYMRAAAELKALQVAEQV
jgi:hypothetical protein